MRTGADDGVRRLSRAQHSIFTRVQAFRCGHTRSSIKYRFQRGDWEIDYPTVYAISGAHKTLERATLGAAYWCGGLVSHRSAAWLMGLQGVDKPEFIEVVTWRPQAKPRAGLKVHFTRKMPNEQVGSIGPFPVTSVERTLFDLCSVLPPKKVAFAMDDALRRGLTDSDRLERCLAVIAKRGRKGTRVFRILVHRRLGLKVAPHSPLETLIHDAIWESDLKKPHLQFDIRGSDGRLICIPDFVYPEEKLIIEGQSYMWHENFEAWQDDSRKLNDAAAIGYRVMWITHEQITKRRAETLAKIRSALRSASG